jgi:penicillin-binding protein A
MFYRSMTVNSHAYRLRRARPVLALAGVAFLVGAIVGASHGPNPAYGLASRFVRAWTRGDYAAMYGDIDASSRRAISAQEFAEVYERALRTATASDLRMTGGPREASGGLVVVPVRVRTRLFGTLHLAFTVRILAARGSGGGGSISDQSEGIAWSRSLEFPGLRPGEVLTRDLALPPRATLLARDGSVLAEGSPTEAGQRASPLGAAAGAALGEVGPPSSAHAAQLEAEGVPAGAIIGVSGAEEALDSSLRGTPGGQLLASSTRPGGGSRVLASAVAHAAPTVRTTISPPVQQAAVTALGDQLGGVVAMQPSTGQILAVAGLGIDDLQPPGSTFKMVTVSGVLQAGIATPSTTFPYATYATLDGVKLSNAGGEECGGSLELAFAVSCNSVFSPLGVKLGAPRLVAMAEQYGFNHEPGIPGAVESTLPPASQIQGELDVGSTAIGQGEVQASPLQMATVAATIADGGHRPQPTFALDATAHTVATATSESVAHTVRRLMIAVVREGTGTAAAIPGVTVAGKTGTAELGSPGSCASGEDGPHEGSGGESGSSSASGSSGCAASSEPSNTDAWFAAFAPALDPRIVVGVLMVRDGAGGATAAPVARQVIEAGLHAGV